MTGIATTELDEKNLVTAFDEIVARRRSVRGFRPDPVPDEIIREIFSLAQLAPSNCNIQPWRVFVASGAARYRLRDAMTKNVMGGVLPNPDYTYPGKFEDPYRRYQVDCAVALYNEMGIGREDKVGRMKAMLRNFELFDAPHVAFIGMHKSFGETVALDVGIYLQTLMLALTSRGISCCAQGSMRSYPDLVRAEFGFTNDIKILVGLSFGYEDESVPANRTRIGRAELKENVMFKEN